MSTTSSSLKSFAAGIAALAAIGLGAANGTAGEFSSATVAKPYAGLSFDVGNKKAVGYFTPSKATCNLTLLVGERGDTVADGARGAVPARFRTPISAGRTAGIETGEGPAIEFFCSTGANWLSARVYERVADIVVAR